MLKEIIRKITGRKNSVIELKKNDINFIIRAILQKKMYLSRRPTNEERERIIANNNSLEILHDRIAYFIRSGGIKQKADIARERNISIKQFEEYLESAIQILSIEYGKSFLTFFDDNELYCLLQKRKISAREMLILRRMNISSLKELSFLTDNQLLKTRGVGRLTLKRFKLLCKSA